MIDSQNDNFVNDLLNISWISLYGLTLQSCH